MTEFRGVEGEALIDSFIRAEKFLRGHDLGKATEEVLAAWDDSGVAAKIREAGSDQELANVMRQTKALPLLSLYQDLFAYHAAAEQADGENHEVQDLYRDLMAWSAFFDETAKPNPAVDKEVKSHVVIDTLNRLAAAGPDIGQACEEKLDTAVADIGRKDQKLADWLEVAVPVVRLLHRAEQTPELQRWLSTESPTQDVCLQKTLSGMCDIRPEEKLRSVPKAMEQYKVILSNQPEAPSVMPPGQWMNHVRNVRKNFQLAMAQLAKTAQVAKIEILPLTKEQDKWGITFYGTKRAAETAATVLTPFHYNVTDPQGQIIPCPPPPAGAAPAPAPGGP
jgi:hypothetical protein